MEGTGSELSSSTGPLDHHVLELRHEEMMEGHGSLNDGSDTLSVFLNFALTKVWVPQWGACRAERFGDLTSVYM